MTDEKTPEDAIPEEGSAEEPEEAEESRWSHVLWNVVGGSEEKLQPVVYKSELVAGDTVLLCTDGLTRHVSNGTLTELLRQPSTTEQACRRLVQAANDAGGTDNITVVVARF